MIVITMVMVVMSNKNKQHLFKMIIIIRAIMSIMGNKHPFLSGYGHIAIAMIIM